MSPLTQNAIHRFTHDWLIRFCELHPTDSAFFISDIRTVGVPLSSKFCRISSYFNSITQRYAPLVMRRAYGDTTQDEIKFIKWPKSNKLIVLAGPVYFQGVGPGIVTKYISRGMYFSMNVFQVKNSVLNLDEFNFCLKQCRVAFCLNTSFTSPVLYSEIWPSLRNYMKVYLNIENLIFDNKMPQMLQQFPQNTPKEWKLYNMSLREDLVLPIVENFMSSPIDHSVQMKFNSDDSGQTCETMANIIEAKFIAAGYTVEKMLTFAEMERTVFFYSLSDDIVCVRYRDET